MENELKHCISRKEYLFKSLQILYDLSKELKNQSKLKTFRARYKHITELRREYAEICDRINKLKSEIKPDSVTDFQSQIAFDEIFYEVVAAADSIPSSASGSEPNTRPSGDIGDVSSRVRLPKLDIPKFDSRIQNWQTFYDTYVALVHNNNSITAVEKYHYLISCLSGTALTIVKGLPVTSKNYEIVFQSLVDRFDNKRLLATEYLEKILNFTALRSPSLYNLSTLVNVYYESVSALRGMDIGDLGEYILFHLTARALDPDTRKRFEVQNEKPMPQFSDILAFLQDYIKILETSEQRCNTHTQNYTPTVKSSTQATMPRNKSSKNYTSATKNTFTKQVCECCSFPHSIYKCPKFQSLSSSAKYNLATEKNLCINCLRAGHKASHCYSKTGCLTCGERHHTLLHNDKPTSSEPSTSERSTGSHTSTSTHISGGRVLVLLGTCTLLASAASGPPQPVRALIDSGAQDCFITSSCARRLGLKLRRCNLTVSGLGQNTVQHVRGTTACTIQPRDSVQPRFDIQPIVMDVVTSNMPTAVIPDTVRRHFRHLTLADDKFDQPAEIDLILGAELFHDIYDGQRLIGGPGMPTALHSVFGWILTGKLDANCRPPSTVSTLVASTVALDDVVQRFWEVEEPPKSRLAAPEDEECEMLYTKLVHQDSDGRYVVPMLLKPHPTLGESYGHALVRFRNLEKRLLKQQQLKQDYAEFMQQYESLNHMQLVKSEPPAGQYFIPHHCVIRPDSTTTKLRVVFDASCKSSNGRSLNDLVYTGPKLQADIVDILTKFRLHTVVFTSDITKMYREILIRPEDRQWQHILWRDTETDDVREYELRTVTYGVSSSPYLAIRTLQQLAADHGATWPHAAEVVRHDVFMDDVITGASSIEQALHLQSELTQLLQCAKFKLHKWTSNSSEFLKTLPFENVQVPKSFSEETNKSTLKILGVQWDPAGDYFTYSASTVSVECTKRSILSNVARIFDPLGWLTPVTLIAKLLLQDLWRLKLEWDEPVPYDIARVWQEFVSELNNLHQIKLPRLVVPSESTTFQLIGFCDGSTKAYGCCVYLRAVSASSVRIHLLIAKSKVAPLKPLTVNRLELCGATLLSRVIKHMFSLLRSKINICDVIAFTDSSTVLSWLNTEPHKLKTFVAHRVVQATDAIPASQWKHVSTVENPADYCSRGLSCSQLAGCKRWWSGPDWLAGESSCWPIYNKPEPHGVHVELKSSSFIAQIEEERDGKDPLHSLITRFSSLTKMQRTTAYCLRFYQNCKLKSEARIYAPLTATEISIALIRVIKCIQQSHFINEIKCIESDRPCNRSIQRLHPFIDPFGLLRVGGRLQNADLPENIKHPYLLPKNSYLVTLIIDHYHVAYLHCGPRTLQSLVQRRFWILGVRNRIRSRLAKCVTCFKFKPIPYQPAMGNLPAPRLEQGSCFQNIGIDFGGPFMIKESKRRNARAYKAYVCLMVCLSTKAVHLELVTELTTEAFIAALDRFIARRGFCRTIITDCGTNFVGAKRYLNDMFKLLENDRKTLGDQFANRSITWKLNPPGAPHFGGIFESGIKSTKFHLKRIIGSQLLTYEEFVTVLTKVEAILNSRPLCVLSSDPEEIDVLTAGHFLIGRPLVSMPEAQFDDSRVSLRSRWQMLQKLTQSFWRIWQRDYLHTLQQRSRWFSDNRREPKVGDIVIILEPNLSTTEWRLGRVEKLFPGKDGRVRVLTLRTAKGIITRPARKVCPLPNAS